MEAMARKVELCHLFFRYLLSFWIEALIELAAYTTIGGGLSSLTY